MFLILAGEPDTLRLGRIMATGLAVEPVPPMVLLEGELGAGKTTLVRGLVEALPGGDEAEVSSPSFNLANLYPTRPETVHVDLYRLNGCLPDESLQEELETPGRLVLVEWAQCLPEHWLPESRLAVRLGFHGRGRQAQARAHGPAARRCLETVQREFASS